MKPLKTYKAVLLKDLKINKELLYYLEDTAMNPDGRNAGVPVSTKDLVREIECIDDIIRLDQPAEEDIKFYNKIKKSLNILIAKLKKNKIEIIVAN